jgi:hypothetical protein
MDLKLEPQTILWIFGLLSIAVGAILLVGQVALGRRYKEISGGLNVRTSLPGLSLILMGLVLIFGFRP